MIGTLEKAAKLIADLIFLDHFNDCFLVFFFPFTLNKQFVLEIQEANDVLILSTMCLDSCILCLYFTGIFG